MDNIRADSDMDGDRDIGLNTRSEETISCYKGASISIRCLPNASPIPMPVSAACWIAAFIKCPVSSHIPNLTVLKIGGNILGGLPNKCNLEVVNTACTVKSETGNHTDALSDAIKRGLNPHLMTCPPIITMTGFFVLMRSNDVVNECRESLSALRIFGRLSKNGDRSVSGSGSVAKSSTETLLIRSRSG